MSTNKDGAIPVERKHLRVSQLQYRANIAFFPSQIASYHYRR
jgi:hypothetical protein